ncbi:MAG TPA: PEP-CTERM sorting domain-containing protein [Verrucomicrobiae bacterium]|nr:PEP-CTERM sorting domain-containing protein [Verrucomicrobiae bacterium]
MKTKFTSTYLLFGTAVSIAMLTAASASAQNIFVANWYFPGAIYSITPGGVESTYYTGGLGEPESIAFDSSGDLFVADAYDGNIDKISIGGTESTFASGMSAPNGLAFNSAGDLFVADRTGSIYEFSPTGMKTTFAAGLNVPKALAFNAADDLFVSDSGSGNIYEFTPGGTKTTFASGITGADGLAFNAAGNLFVGYSASAPASGGIVEISPNGAQNSFVTGLANNVNRLAFDSSGDLFVADNNLLEIAPGGSVSTFASGLGNPTGVAIQGETLPVPEPSTIALAVLGGVAVLLRRLKK